MNKAKEMTDDEYSAYEADFEKSVTKAIDGVEKITAEKEKEILTV
jgi:ribosome recycling factor